MILVGAVVWPAGEWLEWRVDDDRVVRTKFTDRDGFFAFTNGPGFEQRLVLTHEAVATLFAALHYEITGRYFDPAVLSAPTEPGPPK